MTQRVDRRECLKSIAAAVGLMVSPSIVRGQTSIKGTGELRVANAGGSLDERQRLAVFEPFEKESGIKVRTIAHQGPSQVAAQQRTGNIEWDVIVMSKGAMLPLHKQGYIEKIDYDRIDKGELAGVPNEFLHPYAVPNIVFTRGICFNTKNMPVGQHPRSWAEFWNVKKFPGQRSLGAFSGSLTPDLEFALLADGVPIDKLYPLDVERALRSLDRIRPNIAKFWTTGAMAPQMLVDGEVSVASAYFNRIGDLIASGAPLAYEWNQGILQMNFWCILKGAKNYDNAMKLIAFNTRARTQAAFVTATVQGPVNLKALELLPKERAQMLPTSPENMAKQFVYNDEWWADNRAAVQRRWNQWALAK